MKSGSPTMYKPLIRFAVFGPPFQSASVQHGFDEVPTTFRRIWADRSADMLAASKHIRAMRPCAHFTRLPFSTLAKDRTIFKESWWQVTTMRWIAVWNGLKAGRDGLTPHLRRDHAKSFLQMLPARCACDGEIAKSLW